MLPYNDQSSHLRRVWGGRVQKLSVDAGFSCPNRDGSLGTEGCAYCTTSSFVPGYCSPRLSVAEQIAAGRAFFAHKYPKQRYLVYFQANTSTHGQPERLRALFDEALAQDGVCGLVVGTRPDAIGAEQLALLAEYARRGLLSVELGIESTLDRSLERIGRGHGWQAAVDAVQSLQGRGVPVGAHLILGLPGESVDDFRLHARRLSALPIQSLKVHHLQILEGTRFAREWRADPEGFRLFSLEEYLELAADFLERLRPDLVIERLTNEAPASLLLGPLWGGVKNQVFTQRLVKMMLEQGRYQGRLFDLNREN